jgi:site-specific recombinase XerD
MQGNLGLAHNTLIAYAAALEDYLAVTAKIPHDPVTATRETIAHYVHDLATRPNPRLANRPGMAAHAGLANATMQQRITAIRLFYDYLLEQGLRADNPVGRGRFTPGKAFGGQRDRSLIPRYHTLPWIPSEDQWAAILTVVRTESLRTRVMFALTYEAALRREEV